MEIEDWTLSSVTFTSGKRQIFVDFSSASSKPNDMEPECIDVQLPIFSNGKAGFIYMTMDEMKLLMRLPLYRYAMEWMTRARRA
jgi:hypothetical protein